MERSLQISINRSVPFGPPLADDMIKDINRSLKYCRRPNQREDHPSDKQKQGVKITLDVVVLKHPSVENSIRGMQLLCCEVVEKTDAVVYRGKVSAHLSGSNCLGCAARSDLRKWAAAEKFQPSSKSSGHLNATGQKAHSLVDSEKPSNQRPAVIVKSHTTRLPVGNPDGTIIIRTDQYNIDDLRIDYMYAKFFVIKSIGEADVHKSIKYGVWSSSSSGNSKLDSAFRDADRISRRHSTKCPVFLFFSVSIYLLGRYPCDVSNEVRWRFTIYVPWHRTGTYLVME
ncbi:YTH domain-containing protein ECT2 [Zea mays]|uniref:YTH domain-containing protein ECT2 n=1 Tax=Zea mays TaxID=4577 RepID=UPI0009AA5D6D|nr:YTH domain-containing protein ECT2 [Zea mays]|eukprot:XP_020404581.1 uncharacterized protein LOC103648927 [Zea mays]